MTRPSFRLEGKRGEPKEGQLHGAPDRADLPIRQLNRSALQAMLRPTAGEVSRRFITDPEIYRLELERIFARCWVFVAHSSEIPQSNDFVTRAIGEDPVIVIRDQRMSVRVLLNSCRHRGAMIIQAAAGNAGHFTCPYHGWTYNSSGELFGIPERKLWEGVIDPSKCGLIGARVEEYQGLIFASWDSKAPPLKDYLGGMTWYLDLVFGRTDQGLEAIGPPQQWVVDVNWKVAFGNFIGDEYHLQTLHRLVYGHGPGRVRPGDGYQVHVENGHGVGLKSPPADEPMHPFRLQPEELRSELDRHLTPAQLEVLKPLRNIHGAVFPNLVFIETSLKLGADRPPVNLLSLRQLQPRGPDRFDYLSWCLVPKAAPAWRKEAARKLYVAGFGPAGTVEQDDTAVWKAITEGSRGVIAQRSTFHYGLALGKHEPLANWAGPGVAFPTNMTEANERAFIDRWLDLISQD